jgi:crossover junction endodeoxyribonuclease RuvC
MPDEKHPPSQALTGSGGVGPELLTRAWSPEDTPRGRRVVGLDLSLTGTGIADIAAGNVIHTHTVASKGKRSDSLDGRASRLEAIQGHVLHYAMDADLVVVPVAVAPPTVVKKWAAGKGNADKAAVAVGVSRLWPAVEARNDNEWDALALMTMGAQWLGWDVPSRAHHAGCLTKVAWPEVAR